MFELPLYFVVGLLPVKWLRTPDGGMAVLKMDWQTGAWIWGNGLIPQIMMGHGDVEEVSEEEFIQHVEGLRARRYYGEGTVYDLYAVMNAMEDVAKEQGRPLTPEEQAIITELRRKTHSLFEAMLPDLPPETHPRP